MKTIINIRTWICILVWITTTYSYDYLYVRDPRGWKGGQGTIEEAVISVRPKGLYMECGLYLTFSARGLNMTNKDTLEVEFHFDLPQEAIVHDSWLWIGEEIIRATIMDKWTAASIYEDIVKRRRDPSILYKRGNGNYELRIFPMAGTESRKVKITYLVPAQWNATTVLAPLPTNSLQTSRYPISKFYLFTWLDDKWKNPRIFEFPNIEFVSKTDDNFGQYIRAVIPSEAVQTTINYAVDAPFKNGLYLEKWQTGDEGIYQLAFLPSKALNPASISTKAAILVDNDASTNSISKEELLNNLKSMIHTHFTAEDSFNLFFSQLPIYRVSERWLPADEATIENTFAKLSENSISNYSNLPPLLADGLTFIKNNGNDANILLIAASGQVGDYKAANQLTTDLLKITTPTVPIHIADFAYLSLQHYSIGGRSYYGNEYFYTNISRMTTGNYFNIRSHYSVTKLFDDVFQSLAGFAKSFDMHTSLKSGFCHSRFYLNEGDQTVYLNRPVLQIGKYQGSFPFIIEAAGLIDSDVFEQKIEISENECFQADSLSEEIWAGNFINSLELEPQTNEVVSEIVNLSLQERILSLYSAFLCLEPQRGGQVCYDCMDESKLISDVEQITEETAKDSLQAYPNPFNAQTKITVKLAKKVDVKNTNFRIFNVMGQLVRSFEPNADVEDAFQFNWDGTDQYGQMVSSGTYFFVVSAPSVQKTLKLLMLK